MTEPQPAPHLDPVIAALIELHRGLDRQGPGDEAVSRRILAQLPPLPPQPTIADLGCGTGASAVLLADWFKTTVRAVDFASDFLIEAAQRAEQRGLQNQIQWIEADFGALDWLPGELDLLWSEGAAYNLTFAGALAAWKPLLKPGGLAVISELSWFTEDIPAPAEAYWQQAYPAMASEADNIQTALSQGFEVLGVERLPAEAWWQNYYPPLKAKMQLLGNSPDPVMQAVIQDTEAEIDLFERHSDAYGYSVYLLRRL
ncbi:Methyltransferase domain-containing protein [Leptolyngbya sp. BL0902]|uniref:class I SAM-dependent methyltransferase n=1 Tax=Leptolyngbya sp. BL0902 TaxID=1115757 RepID=UPI0018E8EFFC|nr:class I SAM-dependent methyltransferase [Leptolyngbya sp. BL0902]QQE66991.1 Methyltransferase domain-containing protein [Leptolyngbya sp. BL0902]